MLHRSNAAEPKRTVQPQNLLQTEPWLQCRSMNPLGLGAERFVVATSKGSGNLLGFGQLEPKPSVQDTQFLELRTMIVKPEYRCAPVLTQVARPLPGSSCPCSCSR